MKLGDYEGDVILEGILWVVLEALLPEEDASGAGGARWASD